MKNISRFKLSIDRTKAPKKMGTFKDIYLFVNYVFPVEGHFTSLAGVGKEVKTTKAQLQKISSRDTPMAGSTSTLISSVTTRRGREVAVIQIKVKPTVSFHNPCTRAPADPILHSKRRE